MIASKLRQGSHVRVIAPSKSSKLILTAETKQRAIEGLEKLGLTVSFGKYVEDKCERLPITAEQRAMDLHEALMDPSVQGIMPLMGGASLEELLDLIDYDLVKNNPKIFFGLSDTTDLSFALLARAGVISYYGPHFAMLGSVASGDELLQAMKEILMVDATIRLYPSRDYHNYAYRQGHLPEEDRIWAINSGKAVGKCLGGNYSNLNLLLGSQFMPDLTGAVIFIENKYGFLNCQNVKKELEAIIRELALSQIGGLMIGQFKEEDGITREWLEDTIQSTEGLEDVPVVANVDFGQAASKLTLPIGGALRLAVKEDMDIKIDAIK